ncbi:M20/M25/M40 family metallo-hydrolase, partial [Francisella tularensis]|uniref:M20/M25/M40 family metallo-hydrolase n=1 Tax=Francisella tularensis TaxID=263 RepID=UPI00198769D2|nr:amidohydrolase [Francisella tularensis subsp. holarctica]
QDKLKGSICYLNAAGEDIDKKSLHEIANGIATTYQGKVEINYYHVYPETRNDYNSSARSINSAKKALGDNNVIESKYPWMASEDFSYFAKKVPACYAFLGVKNEANGFTSMVHEPNFDLSNEAML